MDETHLWAKGDQAGDLDPWRFSTAIATNVLALERF